MTHKQIIRNRVKTDSHVVRVEHLSVGRVLKEQPLESKDCTDSLFRDGREYIQLQFIQFVIADDFLQGSVKLVEDLSPRIQVRPWPLPCIYLGQNLRKIVRRRVQ